MRIKKGALATMLAIGGSAVAQQPPHGIQQDFNAAETLSAGADHAAAFAAWQALEARVAAKPRSRGIVLVRKSRELIALKRYDEAVASTREGLALLPAGDKTLSADRFDAYLNLASLEQRTLDYASATDAYRLAEQEAVTPAERLAALRGLIRTATFTDPATATAAAARADAVIAVAKIDDSLAADFAAARTLLALNTGDLTTATAESLRAVKLRGGLTEKTDLQDVEVRSNAAIALLLAKRPEEARHYMAMTGAGRMPNGQFDLGAAMTPPDCGGEAGLKPEQRAVVQFSVADDGSVLLAEPIYAEGGGKVALAFARTARQWAWSPDQVQAMPSFLRYNARVELRCNMSFPRPSISDGLMADLTRWSADRGAPVPDEPENAAQALAGQRAALAAAPPAGKLPALIALIRSPVVPREETAQYAAQALQLAREERAPVAGQLALDLTARLSAVTDRWGPGTTRDTISPLVTQQPYVVDPRARAALRLLLADEERTAGERLATLLEQVVGDAALPVGDPLRTGAQIRLASLAQRRGDEAAAKVAFAKTGLTASQCSLVGEEPQLLRSGGTFPSEAFVWGFEGWTRTQFDIAASGRVVNVRAIVSYPPFIFTKAGAEAAAGSVYAKTYRPDGALACGASTRNVKFRIAH